MDAAEQAQAAAVAEVLRARAAGEIELRLGRQEFAALDRIPDEVAGWRTLARVNLDGTQVSDLSPLRGLSELWSVSADDTRVADLSPLAGMTGLRTLWLNRTPVADLAPLADLRSLEYLLLEDTAVSDLTPLRRLRTLSNLSLHGAAGVADISALADTGNLLLLSLDRTAVADIGPVRALRRLARLSVAGTAVQDVSPLAGLAHMAGLFLTRSQVADLRPLQNLSLLAGDPLDQRPTFGLHFRKTPATRLDPELDRLSRIDDADERGAQTLAYLRSLPPWPAPLPWLPPPGPPDVPGAVDAPLQVAVQDGVLRPVAEVPQGLAAQGRRAILDYLADLADQRGRIGNALPRLDRAMAALERALGADAQGLNAIAVGTQGQRVIALAEGAVEVLMDEDAADLRAFAGALALFLDQFPDWRAYRDAAAAPVAAAASVPEVTAVAAALQGLPAVDPGVPAALAGLAADVQDEPADPVLARGLVRSARNVVSALAGAVVSAWRVAGREARDIGAKWWDAQKKAIVGVAVVGTTTLSAQAVGLFQALAPQLALLAQKLPAEFGWLAGFLGWLARVA